MNKKVVSILVIVGIVLLVGLLLFVYQKRSPSSFPSLSFQSKIMTPTNKIVDARGVDYPVGVTDQIGNFVEFSGVVTGVNTSESNPSITLNTQNEGKPLTVELSFPKQFTDTLVYKASNGVISNTQDWKITAIPFVLSDITTGSQILVYVKGYKSQLLLSANSNQVLKVGPIEKLAIYAK